MTAFPLARPILLSARADLCLDYANSRYWRGTEPPTEELRALGDVLAWQESKEAMPPAVVAAMRTWWRERPRLADGAFAAALRLREAVYGIFADIAGGKVPAESDLSALNGALALTPARTELRRTTSGYAWQVAKLRPAIPDLLAPVLWSAADLLTSARLARLRLCANDKCLYLFVDDSRNGTRRWCSMTTCGNRAKAHRHYARHKRA